MKPTKNRVYCRDCGRVKMLFETEKQADTFIRFNREELKSVQVTVLQEVIFVLFVMVGMLRAKKNMVI